MRLGIVIVVVLLVFASVLGVVMAVTPPIPSVINGTVTYVVNIPAQFARSTSPIVAGTSAYNVSQTPFTGGVHLQMGTNGATGEVSSGFYIVYAHLGSISNLNIPVKNYAHTGTAALALNLWFDKNDNGEFFAWTADVWTGTGGDDYALGQCGATFKCPLNAAGTFLQINDTTTFYDVGVGTVYTLAQLKSGSVTGIDSGTLTAFWIGIDSSGGSSAGSADIFLFPPATSTLTLTATSTATVPATVTATSTNSTTVTQTVTNTQTNTVSATITSTSTTFASSTITNFLTTYSYLNGGFITQIQTAYSWLTLTSTTTYGTTQAATSTITTLIPVSTGTTTIIARTTETSKILETSKITTSVTQTVPYEPPPVMQVDPFTAIQNTVAANGLGIGVIAVVGIVAGFMFLKPRTSKPSAGGKPSGSDPTMLGGFGGKLTGLSGKLGSIVTGSKSSAASGGNSNIPPIPGVVFPTGPPITPTKNNPSNTAKKNNLSGAFCKICGTPIKADAKKCGVCDTGIAEALGTSTVPKSEENVRNLSVVTSIGGTKK